VLLRLKLLFGAVLALALLVLAGPASADGFNSATLTVSPNPTVFTDSNAEFEFTGCGYDPAVGVTVVVYGPEATSFFGGPTDASGCIDIVHNGFVTVPGTYDVDATQSYQHGQTVHSVVRASAVLVVTSA
jgi:hypothetical protein